MLYAIPNLNSKTVFQADPWAFAPNVPDGAKTTKDTFVSWGLLSTTKHCYFSAYEGSLSTLRVDTATNPAYKAHGLVVDYDNHTITAEEIQRVKARPITEWQPAYASRTFSGGARLVFLFERPLRLPGDALMREFLKLAGRKLKLNSRLPGWDDDIFHRTIQYYECGTEWVPIEETFRIPYSSVCAWMFEAGNKIDWSNKAYRIPVSEVAKMVRDQFPGRWQGEFLLDLSGVRFWDQNADNPRGCIVRESGMQCFTGPEPFKSWADIFGPKAVEQYQEKQIGGIISDTFFDGMAYWWPNQRGQWEKWGLEQLKLHLRVSHKLRSTPVFKGQNDPSSEVDNVLEYLYQNNRVEKAMPFVHFPTGPIDGGLINMGGFTFLNIATARCMQPANEEVVEWGVKFPWLAKFIDGFFGEPVQMQKDSFLSWLHHFYSNAVVAKPRAGQAIFLVGDPGIGKSLMSNRVIGKMMGGFSDGSPYLLGDTTFTGYALSQPILSVDDVVPKSDAVRHDHYSAMIKKIVASQVLRFEEKYEKSGNTLWSGRVVVSCNADPDSIRMLPNMELSNKEKICLYRCHDMPAVNFPAPEFIDATLAQELPYFCKWLLGFKIPDSCRSTEERFYVAAYHHPQLYKHALQGAACYTFMELLQKFLRQYQQGTVSTDHPQGKTEWEGNATDLLSGMMADEGMRAIASRYKVEQVAILLGQLKSRGYKLNRHRGRTCGRVWIIPVTLEDPQTAQEEIAAEEAEQELIADEK